MKKSPLSGIRSASPKKAAARSAANAGGSSTRLEVAPSSALAVIEPPLPTSAEEMRRVRFGYFKPEARDVHLVGSFNGWDRRATPMHRDALGDWSVEMELPTGEHRYRFFVDGEWRDDPTAQQTAENPFGGFDAIMVVV